jgi:hypothetical protein
MPGLSLVREFNGASEDFVSAGWLDESPFKEFVPAWLNEAVGSILVELDILDISCETGVDNVISEELVSVLTEKERLVLSATNMLDRSGDKTFVVRIVIGTSDDLISL